MRHSKGWTGQEWTDRWCQIGGRTELESRPPLHEGPPTYPSTPKSTPSLHEELAKLGPVERAWVINHELTPAQREELGIKLPETRQIPRKCTCGTEIPCTAHD
jgi:hypothetical protein